MTLQEEIVQLRDAIKKMERLAVQRARRCAIMSGVLAITMLITFVYAYVQRVDADRNAEMVQQKEKQALLAEVEALNVRDMFENCQHELAKCRASQK